MATKILRPYSIGNHDAWSLGAGTSKPTAVDPGDPVRHDADSTYIVNQSADAHEQSFFIDSQFEEKMTSVTSITLYAYGKGVTGAGSVDLRLYDDAGGGSQDSTAKTITSGSYGEVSYTFTTDSNSDSWTEDMIRGPGFEIGLFNNNATWMNITSIWAKVLYTPTVSTVDFPRQLASQILREGYRPLGVVEVDMPLSLLDAGVCERIHLTHPQGPEPTGSGWGFQKWGRRLLYVLSYTYNPLTNSLRAKALDLRRYNTLYWDTMVSPYTAQSDTYTPDGPSRLDRGQTRTFRRGSKAWIEEEGGTIIELGNNKEKITPNGTLFEDASTNFVLNSAFTDLTDNWPDHWSRISTEAVQIATSSPLLFDTDITGQGIKLHRTSMGVLGWPYQIYTCSAELPTGVYIFTCDHYSQEQDGAWIFRRSTDGGVTWTGYWDDSAGSWSDSWSRNTITSPTSITRHNSGPIDVSWTSHDVYQIMFTVQTTDHDLDTRFYHAQLEKSTTWSALGGPGKGWYTSRIVTNDANGEPYNRERDTLYIGNEVGRPAMNVDHGTLLFQYVPLTPSTALPKYTSVADAVEVGLAEVELPSGDMYITYYRDAGIANRFTACFNDVIVSSSSIELTADQQYNLALRWTSTSGELGLSNRAVQLYVDGNWYTGSSAYSELSDLTSDLNFYIGRRTTTLGRPPNRLTAQGHFKNFEIKTEVLSSGEMAGWFWTTS